MKHRTESFTDRAELYKWASEKNDIEHDGKVYKYGKSGYHLKFTCKLSSYKKVIYIKTKKVEFWVNFYGNGDKDIFDSKTEAEDYKRKYYTPSSFERIKTEKFETEIEE